MNASNWEDVYRAQSERIEELERRNAELLRLIGNPNSMHAHYLRHLPGWEVWSTERIRKLNSDNERLERENAELKSTIAVVFDANERGRKAWQEAHPDKQMVWPDQAQLVEWLLQRRQSNEL